MNRLLFFVSNSRTGWMLPACLLVFLSAFLFAGHTSAETGDHHKAYLDALDKVLVAESRIAGEMSRISNGTVAHYDFLQHEHIELLRHARALRHPPNRLSASERDNMIAQADTLLTAAESLELVIADFLRAQALLRSAISNTLDLVAKQPAQGLVTADLDHQQQLASAARAFQADNTPETHAVLDSAYDRVLSLKIDSVRHGELSVQQHLIRSNATEPAAAMGRLAKSAVTPLAEVLQATYCNAMAETVDSSPAIQQLVPALPCSDRDSLSS